MCEEDYTYFDSEGNYIDSEGEDDKQYVMVEINDIIKETIDNLYDLQEFLNSDEYVQNHKEIYGTIIHNVGYLIDKIDSFWTEEL